MLPRHIANAHHGRADHDAALPHFPNANRYLWPMRLKSDILHHGDCDITTVSQKCRAEHGAADPAQPESRRPLCPRKPSFWQYSPLPSLAHAPNTAAALHRSNRSRSRSMLSLPRANTGNIGTDRVSAVAGINAYAPSIKAGRIC